MNLVEQKMLDLLKKGYQEYNFLGIKSEFESEGVRQDELLRITELCYRANLKIGIKIGGGEAITDMYMAKNIGAEYIIAPMIETPYALSKYIAAKNKVWQPEERNQVQFLFNLETITTYNNLHEIIKVAKTENGLDGAVLGRVDFSGSLGLGRSEIDGEQITNYCIESAKICKQNNMVFVVGGGVNDKSLSNIQKIYSHHLTRFETRKVIFDASFCNNKNSFEGIKTAVKFELLQLQNKQNYYAEIANEDKNRIEMLSKRMSQISS